MKTQPPQLALALNEGDEDSLPTPKGHPRSDQPQAYFDAHGHRKCFVEDISQHILLILGFRSWWLSQVYLTYYPQHKW